MPEQLDSAVKFMLILQVKFNFAAAKGMLSVA